MIDHIIHIIFPVFVLLLQAQSPALVALWVALAWEETMTTAINTGERVKELMVYAAQSECARDLRQTPFGEWRRPHFTPSLRPR
ncbi:MAG: hypothetical protein MZV70_54530 [Desulfobacterales bacterium]|nr:hypothetical protein [Desulfobacterales bacterium]